MTTNLHDKMLAAIDALFSASDAVEQEAAENLLLDVRDEINKHKRAEQQPVATLYGSLPVYDKPAQQDLPDLIAGALGVSRGTAYDMMRDALAEQSAQTCSRHAEAERLADALEQIDGDQHEATTEAAAAELRRQASFINQLMDEVARLNKALTWEQNRAERIGTHGPGCHLWGDRHYECLLRKFNEEKK